MSDCIRVCPDCGQPLDEANDPKYKQNLYFCLYCQGYYQEHHTIETSDCPKCYSKLQLAGVAIDEKTNCELDILICPECNYESIR